MPRPVSLATIHEHISGLIFLHHLALCSLLSCLLVVQFPLTTCTGSGGWVSWRYPNPQTNPDGCGWTDVASWVGDSLRNVSWICDPDHVLSLNEAYDLTLLVERYHRESQCDCPHNCSHHGYQIAIALVNRLNTDGEFELMKVKAKNFAQTIRTSWFAGRGCDDNVLIFYSKHDDELYISLGTTTTKVISDIELIELNTVGDRYLGITLSTPKPIGGALHNSSSSIGPTTVDPSWRSPTYDGLEILTREVQTAIVNGPSVTSSLIYSAVIPASLVLILLIMCLLANWCCRPAYEYREPSQSANKKAAADDDDDVEA